MNIDFLAELLKPLHGLINSGMDMAVQFELPALINFAIFAAIGSVTIIGALGVIGWRNLVHSALCLTLSFIGIACLYFFLAADYLGAVQLMVYGGAVSILLVMGVMFTRRSDMAHSNPSRGLMSHIMAVVVSGGFLASMTAVIFFTPFKEEPMVITDTAPGLADLMLTKYILPFEIVAVLLLAALVGAIILAKGVDET